MRRVISTESRVEQNARCRMPKPSSRWRLVPREPARELHMIPHYHRERGGEGQCAWCGTSTSRRQRCASAQFLRRAGLQESYLPLFLASLLACFSRSSAASPRSMAPSTALRALSVSRVRGPLAR